MVAVPLGTVSKSLLSCGELCWASAGQPPAAPPDSQAILTTSPCPIAPIGQTAEEFDQVIEQGVPKPQPPCSPASHISIHKCLSRLGLTCPGVLLQPSWRLG